MRADLAVEHSPSSLAKLLGRSSGAVANALVRLTLDGLAVETSQRPRRYRAAAQDRAA
jgi:biotin operon repressor